MNLWRITITKEAIVLWTKRRVKMKTKKLCQSMKMKKVQVVMMKMILPMMKKKKMMMKKMMKKKKSQLMKMISTLNWMTTISTPT